MSIKSKIFAVLLAINSLSYATEPSIVRAQELEKCIKNSEYGLLLSVVFNLITREEKVQNFLYRSIALSLADRTTHNSADKLKFLLEYSTDTGENKEQLLEDIVIDNALDIGSIFLGRALILGGIYYSYLGKMQRGIVDRDCVLSVYERIIKVLYAQQEALMQKIAQEKQMTFTADDFAVASTDLYFIVNNKRITPEELEAEDITKDQLLTSLRSISTQFHEFVREFIRKELQVK